MIKEDSSKKRLKRQSHRFLKLLRISLRKALPPKSPEFPPPESLNIITDADLLD